LRGRDFGPQDTTNSTVALIINQAAAQHFFPHEDPLGKMVRLNRANNVEIVGITSDSSYTSVLEPPKPVAYVEFAQDPGNEFSGSEGQRTLYIRTTGNPRLGIPVLMRDIEALDSTLPVYGVKTFAQQKSESLVRERLVALLSGFFGGLALLMASLGLYGVVAHSVKRRFHEFGIRLALGADPSGVLRMVMRESLTSVMIGIAIGLVLSFWLSRFLAALLFGISPSDITSFCLATLVLVFVSAVTCYIPARHAMRVDPMIALRYE
jgi:ABC-type antimicrobial peptide transport system permease subunit